MHTNAISGRPDGGAWLAERRKAQEITRAEFAEQVGAPSAAFVEEIETGRRALPAVLHRRVAAQFGVETGAVAAHLAAAAGAAETGSETARRAA